MKPWSQSEIELVVNQVAQGKGYKEIAPLLGRTRKSVAVKMQKSGFLFSDLLPRTESRFCKECSAELTGNVKVFCSRQCAGKYNNKLRVTRKQNQKCLCCEMSMRGRKGKLFCNSKCHKKYEQDLWVQAWKSGNKIGYSGPTCHIAPAIRRYLFEKYNSKCCKCGWSEMHPITGKIPLEVNHIDGDAKNCKEENLELICPNCHSLTPNFRALNKNGCRNRK